MVPTEGVESAQRISFLFASFCNCLQERMLRSQNQNAEIASERTKTKQNEKFLSSIVIKKIGIVHSGGSSQSFELSCANGRALAPDWGAGFWRSIPVFKVQPGALDLLAP